MSSSESCTADAEASEAAGARHPDDAPPLADPPCTNAHTGCGNWARIGECARNPRFMRDGCRSACGLCGARHECVRDVNMRSVFENGALERLMRRVGASHGARAISTDPWLIVIDGFLSKDEARDVVDVAAREGIAASLAISHEMHRDRPCTCQNGQFLLMAFDFQALSDTRPSPYSCTRHPRPQLTT